ncbi:MAG: hypothetical protein QM772_13925 [Ottowia sp.]|uniref:hypothetical protein n=1 Tax=Ottowia sp. TaxID=1898956 RepID=UPI0039E5B7D5
MTSRPRGDFATRYQPRKKILGLHWLWPLLGCAAGWWSIAEQSGQPVHFDAEHVYLPAARAFLEQGWAYLLTPDSHRIVPLAYLWPALWGAEPSWIRMANAGLWGGCSYFIWHTGYLLGGARAGVIAVLLLAVHPALSRYFSTELTEPIFLFGLMGWMYAAAQILIGRKSTPGMSMLGASMLTLTLLSRPVLQLLAPACLGLCLIVLAYRRLARKEAASAPGQRILACMTWSLLLGLIVPFALALKNGMAFGLWGLGTGAGTGLYLGTHPLFQGAEPAFLGFYYDANQLAGLEAGTGDHLSLAGDRVLRSAAMWQLQSMSITDAAAFFGRKLWWWLAHHPASIDAVGGSLRKLRFLELLALIASVVWLAHDWSRRRAVTTGSGTFPGHPTAPQLTFVAFLLAMLLAMLGQLLPILYNSRYSSALLDPWLIALAAWSLACLTAPIRLQGAFSKRSWSIGMASPPGTSLWPVVGVITVVLTSTFGGYNLARKRENIAVDPLRMGQTAIHLDISASDRIETYGMAPQGQRTWVTTESPAVLHVRLDPNDIDSVAAARIANALWKTDLALQSGGKGCRNAEVAYQTMDGNILQPPNKRPLRPPLQADGTFHALVTHANEELRPRQPGRLRIVLPCPIGTQVQWRSTQLLESRHVWDAAAHISP